MMKIKNSQHKFKLDEQEHKSYSKNESNFSLGNAKFNVIHSSEISKVLRELTQCIANDHDIFSHNRPLQILDNNFTKENDGDSMNNALNNNIESATPDMLSSTSNSASVDLSVIPQNKSDAVVDKHTCLQCGKQFNKRDFLQKHKIVHEIPRHKCMACEKSFVREDKLKRHFTSIHSKHRPHICDVCSKAFARKDKLKDHQKHHITAGNSFQCTECHIPFVQKSDLNRHFRGIHKGEVGVGINIPSKRFVKSKPSEEISQNISVVKSDQSNNNSTVPESTLTNSTKTMVLSNSFYPIQTSLLPLNSSNSHITQLNNISDLSKTLIKSNISFIPAIPLKVELNYSTPTSLPQSIIETRKFNNNSTEKENCHVKFKSKKSLSKSKSKTSSQEINHYESMTNKPGNSLTFPFSNCKTDVNTSSAASINCLVSGTTLYPHIPIITPFQSPMISVFPTTNEFYSNNLTSSAKSNTDNNLLFNSSAVINGFKQSTSLDALISTAPSSSAISNSYSAKPINSLGTNNLTFAHQNLYQFQQNQFRYYSYFQPGSHFFGQHSAKPLTTNLYPYI